MNKRIPHIFIGGPHMIISAKAPYKYLEAPRIVLGLTRTIHFRNWGIPINMKFPIWYVGAQYNNAGARAKLVGAPT